MLKDIARFEWRYQTRQITFVAAVLFFFGFGFVLTATGFGPDNVHIDSPYSIARSLAFLSLLSVFVLAVFSANAVVRDREHQMEEIVFTTSVSKFDFLLGRFTGSFLAAFTAFMASAAGMFVARFMPWHEADRLGRIDVLSYLWPLLVLALPNILFAAVTLFAISTITRSVLAAYAASVVLYVLYFVGAALTGSPLMAASAPGASEGMSLAALLDPFGLSAFFEQTQHWIPAERNARLVSLSGNFLLNRLLWLGGSLAGLALVYRLFSFRLISQARKVAPKEPEQVTARLQYEPVAQSETSWQAWWSATKIEIRSFLGGKPFLALTLLWAALVISELVSEVAGGEFGSAKYPSTGVLFGTMQLPLMMVGLILIIYFSTEMVWRERTLRFSGILNATPASNLAFVGSKWTALSALVGVLTFVALAAGAGMQLVKGYPLEPVAMLSFAYFAAVPLMLFALAAVCIQTISPHKYVGMFLVLGLAVVSRADFAALQHPLFKFAVAPPVSYSDFIGFGRTGAFHWFMLYWAALGGLMLLLAATLWRHGSAGVRRLLPIVRRAPRSGRVLAAALAFLFVATGSFIFYNTNVLHAYTTADEMLAWKADFEKKYKPFATMPQPRIRDIRATVELFPSDERYRVRGEYALVNETARPIDKVLLAVRQDADAVAVSIDAGKLLSHDTRFNQYIFALDRPLAPRARTTLRFDIAYDDRGFGTSEDRAVIENGSYLMSFRAFPSVGYRSGYEIEDARERRRRGLPEAAASMQPEISSLEWTGLDLTVTTAPDQIAIAPGRLLRNWEHDGRRSFHYRSDTPIPNQFIIASARYAVARRKHDGVDVEVYYHPSHTYNIERMMDAAIASLQTCSSSFGPYLHPHLRLVEAPAHWNFGGFAQSGVIFLGETRGMLIDARDPRRLDLVYRRVAHEVAHQWWGYNLSAGDTPGSTTLIESLTKYAELLVLEQKYGREAIRESLSYELDRYLSGRTAERDIEPPLMRTTNQAYLYYGKGAIVFYALRDLLGEEAVNTSLRNLLQKQGGADRKATTAHLLAELHAVAPAEHHALIDEWLNDVVLYDLRLESVISRKLPNGKFEVRMQVTASKGRDDGTKLPLNEQIDMAVYSRLSEKPLYAAKHALRDGSNEVVVVVDGEPAQAVADPYMTRVDRNRFDNVRAIK